MDNKKKREQILIRIVCFVLSFGLWLYIYNVENPTIDAKLPNVPVEIINSDILTSSKLAMLPGQKFTVTLQLQGPSSEVYAAKPDQFKVVVDLAAYAIRKGENNIPVSVLQYPDKINIKKNDYLTLKIMLDDLVEKSVPVKLDMDISTKTGYYSFDAITKPTNVQVLVSGAAQYVNSVKWVLAKGSFKNADKDIEMNLPLKAVDEVLRDVPEVKINPVNVDVMVPVKKSKTVAVNVKTKGTLNRGLLLKSIESLPDKIEITGDEGILKNISYLETETLDLGLINASKDVTLKLVVPNGVTLINGKDMINAKINVEGISQRTITKDIAVQNLNQDLKATLDKDKVSIVIQGPEDIINAVTLDDIIVSLDLASQGEGEVTLAPKITTKEGYHVISYTPEKVKVTISKK